MAESAQPVNSNSPSVAAAASISSGVFIGDPRSPMVQSRSNSGRQYRTPTFEMENDATSLRLKSPQQTVLRLKRRVEDSPSKVLLMSYCKRRKNDAGGFDATPGSVEETEDTCTSVFRFAGTVPQNENMDEPTNVADVIRKALTEVSHLHSASKENVKRRDVKLADKAKESVKKNSLCSRFKVVSNKRGIDESGLDVNPEVDDNKLCFNMLDLVAESTESTESGLKEEKGDTYVDPETVCLNGVPLIKERDHSKSDSCSSDIITKSVKESGFVFDLYVTSKVIPTNQICDKYVSVAYEDEWDFGKGQYDNDSDEEIQIPDDDEDSNDEGNWRNDYPDSDPDSEAEMTHYGKKVAGYGDDAGDDDEDFLVDQLGEFRIRGDEDLSSDDGEDEIYTLENNGEDDIVGEGAIMSRYHKYKARVSRELNISSEVVSSPSTSDSE